MPSSILSVLHMKKPEMNTPSIVVMSVAGRVVLVLFQQNVLSHSKKQTLFYYPLTALHRLFRLAFGPHTLMTALALPHMSNNRK